MRLLDSYLELGITGMARAAVAGWFDGHYGAALLAGYFMDREHDLPEHVKEGIERTCETFRKQKPEWFVPLDQDEQADPSLLQHVINDLQQNVKQLRTSGHGLALGVLALKALRERPDMITPTVVDGLVRILQATTEDRKDRYWGIENYHGMTIDDVKDDEVAPYHTTAEMAERAFAELHLVIPPRDINGVRYHLASEVVHNITHAHALTDLERFGYEDIVKPGIENHRLQLYLNRHVPPFTLEDEVKEPAFDEIFSPLYWDRTYSDPHALKLPYAALDLLKRFPPEKRDLAERNLCKLLTITD
ncbi:hypothetical protein [Brevibacillus brevis]|uniref:hypothetical protein n=1 Tax=Brevibacillus brevis TaxID=1393 RepID=UPI0025A587E5|nr:hypothetical protein [Brevibacillus brevis]WJQ82008.1 hypothetical protein QN310_02260 [Brevibacillus brevis]